MTAPPVATTASAAAPPPGGPSEKPASSELDAATAQVTRFNESIDKIRSRSDTAAKTLAGFGGAALSAVGIAKSTDLIPQYFGIDTVLAVVAVLVGFGLVAWALVKFTSNLWQVSKPVFTSSNLEKTTRGWPAADKRLVEDVYRDMARLNGAPSLLAYEARGWRLQRAADRTEGDRRAELQRRADTIRAEVLATQARASALVVRHRASDAVAGPSTRRVAVGLFAGIVLFAAGSGVLTSARDDAQVATAQGCAEALSAMAKAGRTIELPNRCDGTTNGTAANGNPDARRKTTEIAAHLAGQYRDCVSSPTPQSLETCDAILAALRAVTADASG